MNNKNVERFQDTINHHESILEVRKDDSCGLLDSGWVSELIVTHVFGSGISINVSEIPFIPQAMKQGRMIQVGCWIRDGSVN